MPIFMKKMKVGSVFVSIEENSTRDVKARVVFI
jgi:hypothetical protein